MSWPNANAMLKAHIVKKRREITVNVSLELDKGRSLGLFGASGAGKSTVLACIAGIEEPDEGYVNLASSSFFRRLFLCTKGPSDISRRSPASFLICA